MLFSVKMPPGFQAAPLGLGLLLLIFALLVGNAAAGLAGGLAGSLALAAAAVLGALAQVAGLKGLDSLHGSWLLSDYSGMRIFRLTAICILDVPKYKALSAESQSSLCEKYDLNARKSSWWNHPSFFIILPGLPAS